MAAKIDATAGTSLAIGCGTEKVKIALVRDIWFPAKASDFAGG